MKIAVICPIVLVGLGLIPPRAGSAESVAFTMKYAAFTPRTPVLIARLTEGTAALSAFARKVAAEEATVLRQVGHHPGISGEIVIAIKPGRQSQAWIDFGSASPPDPIVARMKAGAESIRPPAVREGPVAVAIVFDAWGGGPPLGAAPKSFPLPKEWQTVLGEPIPDAPLARVWP